jgi:hypothetical protein
MYHTYGDVDGEDYLVTSYNELCSYEDKDFIIRAYVSILDRYPDPVGERYYLSRLQAGYSKVQVLDQINRSGESGLQAATVPGLRTRLRQHRRASLFGLAWLFRLLGYTEGNSQLERRDRALLRALTGIRTQVGELGAGLRLAGPAPQVLPAVPVPQIQEGEAPDPDPDPDPAIDATAPDARQAKQTLNLGDQEFTLPLSMDSRTRQLIEALEREILLAKKVV